LAGVLAALGGSGIGIAITEYHPPWKSAWFIAGAVVCGLGCLSVLWALVLYVAHRVAGDHWCPDPEAHTAPPRQRAGAVLNALKSIPPAPPGWLRPALREMNGDLRQAATGIERALNDDSYRAVEYEFNLGSHWEVNRERLAGLSGRGDLYDDLREAYAHIERIRRIISGSPTEPGAAAPAAPDNLDAALTAIRKAETAVGEELSELDKHP
jgi:hypothetical protein